MTRRLKRSLAYEEAIMIMAKGGFAAPAYFSPGWFVWATTVRGDLYEHNPHHGSGPSMRDHAFTATDQDRAARWHEVTL